MKGFAVAHLLHINFYEDWLTGMELKVYAEQIDKLITKLGKYYEI